MKAKTLDALLDKCSRCPICNATMKQERDTMEGTLLEASDECTNCGRYYYQFAYGSHETYVGFFRHRFGWHHTDTISVIQEEYRLEKKAVKWERFKWKWWGPVLVATGTGHHETSVDGYLSTSPALPLQQPLPDHQKELQPEAGLGIGLPQLSNRSPSPQEIAKEGETWPRITSTPPTSHTTPPAIRRGSTFRRMRPGATTSTMTSGR